MADHLNKARRSDLQWSEVSPVTGGNIFPARTRFISRPQPPPRISLQHDNGLLLLAASRWFDRRWVDLWSSAHHWGSPALWPARTRFRAEWARAGAGQDRLSGSSTLKYALRLTLRSRQVSSRPTVIALVVDSTEGWDRRGAYVGSTSGSTSASSSPARTDSGPGPGHVQMQGWNTPSLPGYSREDGLLE